MSTTSPFAVITRARGHRGLVTALTLLGVLVLAPATAHALQVDTVMPDSVTVGQTGLTAHVRLTNTEAVAATVCNPEDQGVCKGAAGISFVGSCASPSIAPACATPDPGDFAFATTATVAPASCGATVTGFALVLVDPAIGSARLVPQGASSVILGPVGTPAAVCDITLTFDVIKLPAADADPAPGVQTRQSAFAQAVPGGAAPTLQSDDGPEVTTVLAPSTTPPPPPPPVPGPPPPPAPTAPAGLDHFKCYDALQPNLRQRTVVARDQFGQVRTRVLRTRQLCNPVSKNEGKVLNPRAHLACYETRDQNPRFTRRTVLVTNQFGRRKLTVLRPSRLCVPSLKRKGTGAAPTGTNPERVLDHLRCYDVKAQSAPKTVVLRDQFGQTQSKVLEVIRLCNPVRKNTTPVRNAKAHLVCYSIRDNVPFRPLAVVVRNQFGRAALRVRAPRELCLPSFKEVIATTAPAAAPAGLDHLKCYEAEQPQFQPRNVGLRDQFGLAEAQVLKVGQLCNPVSKNSGRVLNKGAHLVCYETRDVGVVPFQPREVRVSNQFGIRQLSVIAPTALCVPSLKRKGAGAAPTGTNPELVLDHFRCYDVKPVANPKVVKLVDQFKTTKTKVLRLVRLCNPVRKNTTPVKRAQAHLVCYSISEVPFQPLAVTVRNQFGVAGLRVGRPQMLCLPSLKHVITAAGTVAANPS